MKCDKCGQPIITDEWIETELWNFVHAAALDLELPKSAEMLLHHSMVAAITAHALWVKDKAGAR